LHLAQCSPRPIATFAIGYKDRPTYDETRYARLMADRLGSDHHEFRLGFDEVIDTLPAVLDHLGEPFFDSSILPTAVVSRLARRHVTVCLSGDGGDELFGGYYRYLGHESIDSYQRLPALLRNAVIEPLTRRTGASKSSRLADRVRQFRKLLRAAGLPIADRHLAWSQILSPDAHPILRCESDDTLETIRQEMARLTAGLPESDAINRILAFDLQYALPSDMLHKVDLASMMHSLEVRVPFLDPQVVETALACPSSWKVHKGLRKRLLVHAYRGRLPDEILDRPKMGFELPIGEFLRGPLRDMFNSVVSREQVESLQLLDYDAVQDAYAAHCARRSEHADLLFAVLSLCWWHGRTR
jgi:asparagine synthase (glutamine-hydrolysing)